MGKGRRRKKKTKKKAKAHQGDGTAKQNPTSTGSGIATQFLKPLFLKLPPEIRIQIYSYAIHPETGPFSDFDGLYKSCRLIKKETDYECGKILHKYLTKIKSKTLDDPELRFHMPMSFAALRNLRISLSTDTFHARNKLRRSSEVLLEHLKVVFALHLDTLVITYHESTAHNFGMMHIRWLMHEILNKAMRGDLYFIKAEKIVFDLPAMSKDCAETWLGALCHSGLRPNTWTPLYRHRDWDPAKLVMGRRRRSVAIFTKTGSDGTYTVTRGDVWMHALQGKRYWLEKGYAAVTVIVIVFVVVLNVLQQVAQL